MTAATGIHAISLITLPVSDQDASVAYYEKMGFEKRVDTPFGGRYRWIEVYPPAGSTGIALAPPPEGREVTPQSTGITLNTADIDATHAALREQSIDVDAEVQRMGGPVPPMFWLRDPDGHSLLVVETAAAGE